MRTELEDGFTLLPRIFTREEIAALVEAIGVVAEKNGVRSRGGVYAIRNLLDLSPAMRQLANSPKLRTILETHLGSGALPVRATLFDKIAGANWLVPWHQDLTICVEERIDIAGYGPWTRKAGVQHVQPPVRILEAMLSARVHLDDSGESNGALRVLRGTHTLGRLSAERISNEVLGHAAIACGTRAGDVLLMRPLLVHSSSAASQALHRRVIHIDYASVPLDGGLRWRIL